MSKKVNTKTKINSLEDAINQAAGEKALSDTKKFGALTQSVLNDTIEEMKRAKGKEQTIVDQDGWTVKTADSSMSAHFEDTIIITENTFNNVSMGYCWTCAAIVALDGSSLMINNNLILLII